VDIEMMALWILKGWLCGYCNDGSVDIERMALWILKGWLCGY